MLGNTPSTNKTSSKFSPLSNSYVPEYIRRIFRFRQMDIDYAISQMLELFYMPENVFKTSRNRKFIKDYWARDDPAFVVIFGVFMIVVSLAYSCAFHSSFLMYLRFMVYLFIVDFLSFGVIQATFTWLMSNKFLRTQSAIQNNEKVEWLYAFDVHCNAFFPLFMLLYVLQYIALPVLSQDTFTSLFLSNSLFAIAFSFYFYVTFRGFLELQYLQNTDFFLYPIAAIVLALLFATFALRFSCTRFVISLYFG